MALNSSFNHGICGFIPEKRHKVYSEQYFFLNVEVFRKRKMLPANVPESICARAALGRRKEKERERRRKIPILRCS